MRFLAVSKPRLFHCVFIVCVPWNPICQKSGSLGHCELIICEHPEIIPDLPEYSLIICESARTYSGTKKTGAAEAAPVFLELGKAQPTSVATTHSFWLESPALQVYMVILFVPSCRRPLVL